MTDVFRHLVTEQIAASNSNGSEIKCSKESVILDDKSTKVIYHDVQDHVHHLTKQRISVGMRRLTSDQTSL